MQGNKVNPNDLSINKKKRYASVMMGFSLFKTRQSQVKTGCWGKMWQIHQRHQRLGNNKVKKQGKWGRRRRQNRLSFVGQTAWSHHRLPNQGT